MGDFVPLSPVAVGSVLGAAEVNDIITDIPQVWDFPAFAVNQTLNATDLLQSAFVVPSNSMGDHRRLTLHCKGTLKNATGGNVAAPAFSVLYGSTTLVDSGLGPNLNSSATLGFFDLWLYITQNGATNAQNVVLTGFFGDKDDVTDFNTGAGLYTMFGGSPKGGQILGWNNTTVDFNASAILSFKARPSTSSSNNEIALEVGKAWIL